MAALDGALALAQMDEVAEGIAQYLYLDVARLCDELFQKDGAIAKRGQCLAPRPRQLIEELAFSVNLAHALAAAASRSFDEYRETDALCLACQRGIVLAFAVVARHGWRADRLRQLLGLDLSSPSNASPRLAGR